jgi:hypothetical protein
MRRSATEEELWNAPVRSYDRLRILPDGRVRLGAGKRARGLEFVPQRYSYALDGSCYYDSSNYSISVREDGETVYLLFIRRSRVRGGTFAVDLDPRRLGNAVRRMRAAGLGSWVNPGLHSLDVQLRDLRAPNDRMFPAIRGLLRSGSGSAPAGVPGARSR